MHQQSTGMTPPSEDAKNRVAKILGKEWSTLDADDRRTIVNYCSLRLARAATISVVDSRAIIALLRRGST
jgi:hypothetical protein